VCTISEHVQRRVILVEHLPTGLCAQFVLLRVRHNADTVWDTVEEVWRQVFPRCRHAHKFGVRLLGAAVCQLRHIFPDHHSFHSGARRSKFHCVHDVIYLQKKNYVDISRPTFRKFCLKCSPCAIGITPPPIW